MIYVPHPDDILSTFIPEDTDKGVFFLCSSEVCALFKYITNLLSPIQMLCRIFPVSSEAPLHLIFLSGQQLLGSFLEALDKAQKPSKIYRNLRTRFPPFYRTLDPLVFSILLVNHHKN